MKSLVQTLEQRKRKEERKGEVEGLRRKKWSEGGKNRERRNETGKERRQGRKIFDFLIDFSLSLLFT